MADHVIHTAAGRLSPKSSTTAADVQRIVEQACAAKAPGGIVVHFHGGLVSEKSARTSASEALFPLYKEQAQAYPIFFIWESGFFEAPLNNLGEILHESLFREFMKKSAVWVLKKLGGVDGLKGDAEVPVDEATLKNDMDAWFNGARATPPAELDVVDAALVGGIAATSKGSMPDEEKLVEQIEASFEDDDAFRHAVESTYNGIGASAAPVASNKGTGSTVASDSLISKEASERMFDAEPGKTKGVISWFKVAKTVATIVIRTIRRRRSGRSHGGYVTLVEECLRELYLDKIGREIWWDRMKGDTADAFRDGDEYGGTAFLHALKHVVDQGGEVPKITLVGHSTGAIYICNLLRAANRIVPGLKYHVIFEAPAVSHDVFAATLAEHATSIRFFRLFGMSDPREQDDDLVKVLYPASLLYFVSGMLEREVDLPLVGMERFLINDTVFGNDDFWSIEVCRKFFARHSECLIWSPHQGGPGLASTGKSHSEFDDKDRATLDSVAYIILNQPR
ncbi:MAG: alpha/beta hydrolase [Myxococcales bacterium]